MKPSRPLQVPLRKELTQLPSDEAVMRVRRAVFSTLSAAPKQTKSRYWLSVACVTLGLVLAVFGVFLTRDRFDHVAGPAVVSPGPLLTRSGSAFVALEGADHPARQHFSDGSTFDLAAGGKVVGLASTSQEFAVLLERGTLHASVVPGGPRRWVIEAKFARIEVIGTEFTVSRTNDSIEVSVVHGVVLVRSMLLPQGVVRLTSGERARMEPRSETPTESKEHTPTESPARIAVGANPAAHASVDELFAVADQSRLRGNLAGAEAALERITREYPHDSRIPVAHYTLGLVRLAGANGARRAIPEFERVVSLSPSGSVRQDALSRLVETYHAVGEGTRARELLAQYRREFPSGRHLKRLTLLLQADPVRRP